MDNPQATDYELLAQQVGSLAEGTPGWLPALANAAALLGESLPDINWVGLYVAVTGPAGEQDLALGPFWGRPACVGIPFGAGVCGRAIETNEPQPVPDVHAFPGHIACDAALRARSSWYPSTQPPRTAAPPSGASSTATAPYLRASRQKTLRASRSLCTHWRVPRTFSALP